MPDREERPVRAATSSFRTNWCQDIPRIRVRQSITSESESETCCTVEVCWWWVVAYYFVYMSVGIGDKTRGVDEAVPRWESLDSKATILVIMLILIERIHWCGPSSGFAYIFVTCELIHVQFAIKFHNTEQLTVSPHMFLYCSCRSSTAYRVGQKIKPDNFCNNFVYCKPIFIIFGIYAL